MPKRILLNLSKSGQMSWARPRAAYRIELAPKTQTPRSRRLIALEQTGHLPCP